MLIDCSYFTKGSRQILNATMGTLPNPNAQEVLTSINAYIAENQEGFLMKMLGETLGNKVHTYLVCQDDEVVVAKQANFEAVCARLREPFADYVFFQILRTCNTRATINGLVMLKVADTHVSPIRRQVITWNSMVDKNTLFVKWTKSDECKLTGISTSESMLTKINPFNL